MHRFRRSAAPAFAAEAAAEADLMTAVAETIRTRSLLRQATRAGQGRLLGRLDVLGDRALAAQQRTVVVARWLNAMALVEGIGLAALLGLGAVLVGHGRISIGVVVTFVLAGRTLFTSFTDLTELMADAEQAATLLARARDLIQLTEFAVDGGPAQLDRALVAEDVSFGYAADTPVVCGISLTVRPGDRVCLIGRTGCGKSTLAKLLAGLYAPDQGTIRFAGVDLAAIDPQKRARLVAYLRQQVQLGTGRVRDELLLAAPNAPDEQLRQAAAALGLTDWLAGLAAGLDTHVDRSPVAGPTATHRSAADCAVACVRADPGRGHLGSGSGDRRPAGAGNPGTGRRSGCDRRGTPT